LSSLLDHLGAPYVPGETARPDLALFEPLKDGLSLAALSTSRAWTEGHSLFQNGYFWEAHELWEAVWMVCLEDTPERNFVQLWIQIANARLKLKMNRPNAVLRLIEICEEKVAPLCTLEALLGIEITRAEQEITNLSIIMHK
jgi:hypothetical protein